MNQPWKVVFAFVTVFIAGAVFGGVFTLRTAGPRPPNFNQPPLPNNRPQVQKPPLGPQIGPAMMRQLGQRLKLNEEQREKIRPIVARAEEDLQRLRRQNFQDTTRVMERMHADVAMWLSPEQREELEVVKINMRERMQRAEKEERRGPEFQRDGQQTQNRPPGEFPPGPFPPSGPKRN